MKKNKIIRQQNELSEACKNWNILMTRCYGRVVQHLDDRIDELIKAEKKEAEKKYYTLFAELNEKGWSSEWLKMRLYRQELTIKRKDGRYYTPTWEEFTDAVSRLQSCGVTIGDKNKGRNVKLIGDLEWDKSKDCMVLHWTTQLVEYILQCRDRYTSINPAIVFAIQSSKYTFRFYEWCNQWKKTKSFKFSLLELKEKLFLHEHEEEIVSKSGKRQTINIPEKYKSQRDFIQNVIEPAKKELDSLFEQDLSNVCFNYEKIYDNSKPGRRTITDFVFTIKEKKREKLISKPLTQEEKARLLVESENLHNSLRMYFSENAWNREWLKDACSTLLGNAIKNNDRNIIRKVSRYARETVDDFEQHKIRSVPAVIRSYFEKSLGIKKHEPSLFDEKMISQNSSNVNEENNMYHK